MSFLAPLQTWMTNDTWMVVIGALAAMACALPGCFLLLRRQSMMGDAISHTSLLGIVAAFFASHWLVKAGVIAPSTELSVRHLAMCVGAVAVGVLSAWLAESLQKLGNVEASAALAADVFQIRRRACGDGDLFRVVCVTSCGLRWTSVCRCLVFAGPVDRRDS